ncbi:hypothetical protein LIA77_08920 [Sarocladium implicatum]|nr:hypothetical protein LIA77_08920 [Sarocladium implicatum]
MPDENIGSSYHASHYPLNGLDLDFSRYRHHTITGLDIIASQLLDLLHQILPPVSWSLNKDLSSPSRGSSFTTCSSSIEPLYLALSRATSLQPHPTSQSSKRPYGPNATDLYDLLQRWNVQQTSDHLRHLIRRENHYINTAPPKKGVTKQPEPEDEFAVSQAANAALTDLQHVKRTQYELHLYSGKGFGNVLPRYRKLQRRSTRDPTRTPQVTAPFPPGQEFNLHDGVWPTQHLLGWNSDQSLASSGPLLGGQDVYTSATTKMTARGRKRSRSLIDLDRFAVADIPNSSRESADHLCDQVFHPVASLESIAYRLRSRSLSRSRIVAMFLPSNTPSYNQGTTSRHVQSPPFADPDLAHKKGRCKNCGLDISAFCTKLSHGTLEPLQMHDLPDLPPRVELSCSMYAFVRKSSPGRSPTAQIRHAVQVAVLHVWAEGALGDEVQVEEV